ncbi:hypothetical protein HDU67_007069 [Dinochytrium kinnereticum]|nr:hypothetical protein HDU67_007069 [Dinochytrium kinnereticum]
MTRLLSTSTQFRKASEADIAHLASPGAFPIWLRCRTQIRVDPYEPAPPHRPLSKRRKLNPGRNSELHRLLLRHKVYLAAKPGKIAATAMDLPDKGWRFLREGLQEFQDGSSSSASLDTIHLPQILDRYEKLFKRIIDRSDLNQPLLVSVAPLSVLVEFCCFNNRPDFATAVLERFESDVANLPDGLRSLLLQSKPYRVLLAHHCRRNDKTAALEGMI